MPGPSRSGHGDIEYHQVVGCALQFCQAIVAIFRLANLEAQGLHLLRDDYANGATVIYRENPWHRETPVPVVCIGSSRRT